MTRLKATLSMFAGTCGRSRRLLGFLTLGIVALLALSACNAGSEIVVRPDGSGTFSTLVTVEGSGGDALYQSVLKAESQNKVPLSVSRYAAGGESGARISAPFRSLNDLTALGNNLGSSTGLAGVAVARHDSGWTFSAHSNESLMPAAGGTATGSTVAGSTGGAIDGAQLTGLIQLSVSVELPGAPGHSNADTVTHTADSTTFVWKMGVGRAATDLTAATTFVGKQGSVQLATALTPLKAAGSPARASASSGRGLGGGAITGIGAGVVLLLVGGAVVVVLVLRSRRPRSRAGSAA